MISIPKAIRTRIDNNNRQKDGSLKSRTNVHHSYIVVKFIQTFVSRFVPLYRVFFPKGLFSKPIF